MYKMGRNQLTEREGVKKKWKQKERLYLKRKKESLEICLGHKMWIEGMTNLKPTAY